MKDFSKPTIARILFFLVLFSIFFFFRDGFFFWIETFHYFYAWFFHDPSTLFFVSLVATHNFVWVILNFILMLVAWVLSVFLKNYSWGPWIVFRSRLYRYYLLSSSFLRPVYLFIYFFFLRIFSFLVYFFLLFILHYINKFILYIDMFSENNIIRFFFKKRKLNFKIIFFLIGKFCFVRGYYFSNFTQFKSIKPLNIVKKENNLLTRALIKERIEKFLYGTLFTENFLKRDAREKNFSVQKFLLQHWLEIAWALFPASKCLTILYPSLILLFSSSSLKVHDVIQHVTANQWYWNYSSYNHNFIEPVPTAFYFDDERDKDDPIIYRFVFDTHGRVFVKSCDRQYDHLLIPGFFYPIIYIDPLLSEECPEAARILEDEMIYNSIILSDRIKIVEVEGFTFYEGASEEDLNSPPREIPFNSHIYHGWWGSFVRPTLILSLFGKDDFDSYMLSDLDPSEFDYPFDGPYKQFCEEVQYYYNKYKDINSQIRLYQTDHHFIMPVFYNLNFLINSMDVLHSFTILSTGVKVDAITGRVNEMSISVLNEGLFFGQCSELCGTGHLGMPIAAEALFSEDFYSYVEYNSWRESNSLTNSPFRPFMFGIAIIFKVDAHTMIPFVWRFFNFIAGF